MPSLENNDHALWQQLSAEMGEFEFLGEIGRGGSGAVFHARQVSLDREVALKILLTDEHGARGWDDKRFEREARALASLSHPGIVQLFDFGQSVSGLHYIVMEYVEGRDLAELIQEQGTLTPEQAVGYTIQLCDALEHAHRQGIVHRDMKPANVLVTHEGLIKITDFGLAKIRVAGDTEAPRSTLLAGTPDYLPPEAFAGEPVWDRRADTYALGVMLYQMLTGSLPRGAIRIPSAWVTGLLPHLDQAVMRSIAGRPEDRFQTAAEMQARLSRCWAEGLVQQEAAAAEAPSLAPLPQIPAPPPMPLGVRIRRLEPEWWLVVAVVLLMAAAFAWMLHQKPKSPPTEPAAHDGK